MTTLTHRITESAPWVLDALALPGEPTRSEVKRAYRQRAKECHPDAGGSAEAFNDLTRARDEAFRIKGWCA